MTNKDNPTVGVHIMDFAHASALHALRTSVLCSRTYASRAHRKSYSCREHKVVYCKSQGEHPCGCPCTPAVVARRPRENAAPRLYPPRQCPRPLDCTQRRAGARALRACALGRRRRARASRAALARCGHSCRGCRRRPRRVQQRPARAAQQRRSAPTWRAFAADAFHPRPGRVRWLPRVCLCMQSLLRCSAVQL